MDNWDPNHTIVSETIKTVLEEHESIGHSVKFHQHLLKDDERLSKMDLEYHIDYVQQFGVKELIPKYDELNFFTYRNWDVYVVNWTLLCLVLVCLNKLCFCSCSWCKSGKRSKV